MSDIIYIIANNIKRLRNLKDMSQKEVSLSVSIPQGQYSRIENGKVMPTIPTLEKIASLFEVSLIEFFKNDNTEDVINLPLLEKIKVIETLEEDERNALIKMIDMAISNKKLKDNLTNLIS